jgi:hypothetical protein
MNLDRTFCASPKHRPEMVERFAGVIVTESRKGGAYGFAHISAIGIAQAALAEIKKATNQTGGDDAAS